jgi:hypothetical protein
MTGYGMFDPAYTDDVLAAIVVSVVGYLTSSAKPLAISAPETVRRKVNSLHAGVESLPVLGQGCTLAS